MPFPNPHNLRKLPPVLAEVEEVPWEVLWEVDVEEAELCRQLPEGGAAEEVLWVAGLLLEEWVWVDLVEAEEFLEWVDHLEVEEDVAWVGEVEDTEEGEVLRDHLQLWEVCKEGEGLPAGMEDHRWEVVEGKEDRRVEEWEGEKEHLILTEGDLVRVGIHLGMKTFPALR